MPHVLLLLLLALALGLLLAGSVGAFVDLRWRWQRWKRRRAWSRVL